MFEVLQLPAGALVARQPGRFKPKVPGIIVATLNSALTAQSETDAAVPEQAAEVGAHYYVHLAGSVFD